MNEDKTSSGIGFFGALTILFIALKLLGIIHWGWGAILAPLWGPLAFALIVVLIVTLVESVKK